MLQQKPTRAGAGAVGTSPTGKGPRVGNTPHTDTGNNDEFPQRHRSANKKVEKTSKERFDVRKNGQQN